MSRDSRRDWWGLGCAALLGASIALPIGLAVGGGGTVGRDSVPPGRARPAPGEPRTARNPFSPRVVGDPYVIDQQRRVLQSLELACRQSNTHCTEAEQARHRIEDAEAQR